ncbi:hypothetical protein V6N12_050924 [Hibiscus sabdariffa]|uniref:RNase H type-1 domain-containing protein n=1 Tax=Hibiscus sabdariffa TaxID=183260 RepID=A0ABR2GEE4_9ROSI
MRVERWKYRWQRRVLGYTVYYDLWLIWKQRCNATFDNISSNGIAWVSRFQNVVADKLATLSRDRDLGEIVWVNPPGEVLDALHHDMARIPV